MNKIQNFFDKITFKQTFIFWICFIFVFGVMYFVLSFSESNSVLYGGEKLSHNLFGFLEAQYYSFITGLSASQFYGDFLSKGWSRFLAVFETLCGLLLFGVLITKLVSVKQERILEEIYGISFDEKIHRIRYAFYLFRVEVNKLLGFLDGFSRKPFSILSLISSFNIALQDTYDLVCVNNDFAKNVDAVRLELLIVGIERSFLKLSILLKKLESKNISWRNEDTLQKIRSVIDVSIKLSSQIKFDNVNLAARLDNIKQSTLSLENYLNVFKD